MIRVFTSDTQKLGQSGEDLAVDHLVGQGYRIVERNAPNKFGEIDIVARKGQTYYFFEVKAGSGVINPAENLHPAKIRKFLVSCEHYAMVRNIKDYRALGITVLIRPERPLFEIFDLL